VQHDLLNATEVREYFGGSKLITVSALYRGMAIGRYPRPVHVGGARWIRSECEAAVAALIVTRDAALADQMEDA
jgi:predicted DNA-binding transcriptional regulator AlpA